MSRDDTFYILFGANKQCVIVAPLSKKMDRIHDAGCGTNKMVMMRLNDGDITYQYVTHRNYILLTDSLQQKIIAEATNEYSSIHDRDMSVTGLILLKYIMHMIIGRTGDDGATYVLGHAGWCHQKVAECRNII